MAEYTRCDRCGKPEPGTLVRVDGVEESLCYPCFHDIWGDYKVVNWIDKHGKLQF